jgi:acetoin utilization deacetylase AcuC-like enzyme
MLYHVSVRAPGGRRRGRTKVATQQIDVFWHEDALKHDTGWGVLEAEPSPLIEIPERHPENDVRIRNMKSILERGPVATRLEWRNGRYAEIDELTLLHDHEYVESIRAKAESGGGRVSGTTVVSPATWDAACAAAGTAIEACNHVLAGRGTLSLALVRPPGHHAQPAVADGYCFFNNAALAAEHAVRQWGLDRVAILDWDVHHGNGTQQCFYSRPDVLTISMHMRHGSWGPSHPQTGSPAEIGYAAGTGFNVNVELPSGTGDTGYLTAMRQVVMPIIDAYEPQLLILPIGQDANQFDPNGRMLVTMRGFHALSMLARELAERHTDCRIVAVQEGGYARTYSAFCLHGTVEGLLGIPLGLADPLAYMPDDVDHAGSAIAAVQSALSRHWRFS